MTAHILDAAASTIADLAARLSRQGFVTEAMSAQRCARDLREAALKHRAAVALAAIYRPSEMPADDRQGGA